MRLLPVITGALVAGSALAPAAARAATPFDPAGHPRSVAAEHVHLGPAARPGFVDAHDVHLGPAGHPGFVDVEHARGGSVLGAGLGDAEDIQVDPVTEFVDAQDIRVDPVTGFVHTEDIRFDPVPGFVDAEDIRFDPATNTGFVGAEDVRKAFGWDEAGLVRNAPEVGFTYHVGKEAIYAVTCEKGIRIEAGHNPGSTSAGLDAMVAWETPGRTLTGFRITGVSSGASSMDVPPEPGLPCPDDKGGEIRSARYLNTIVTTGLSAEFRDVQVYFPQHRTVTTAPPEP
ncbi:hypothetical protein [Actinoplanes philippinensis]|uniref:hypothetical protein n=1 Tax=Actinoplanes philippinensis TaxID=35752 RepID=UPI0033C1A759